jgi:predicted nucleic acid-binding protein
MSPAEAEQALALTFRPLLAVHSSYSLYGQALELTRSNSISWYDSLIVAAAMESDCRILYSEDLQHGQKLDNLRIQNPFL